MDLSHMTPAKGSTHHERRIGRGQGSGYGGTSTRGHKGAQSRSGYTHKRGFEGGQMPLQRRLPKYGFTNTNKVEFKAINLGILDKLATDAKLTKITPEEMHAAGLISKNDVVKVLAFGKLAAKIDVEAHAFSATAKAAIEALGGTVTIL